MKRTLAVALLVAPAMWAVKKYYADAPVDELQWILGPTASLVTAVTRVPFEWEPGQGYLSRERFLVIAKACAGINFMIAAFGMVAVMRGRRARSCRDAAGALLMAIFASYSAAVFVNAMRITVAIWLTAHPLGIAGLTAAQVHRVEGVACYFGGLVLLYELMQYVERGSECVSPSTPELVPLLWYLVITVAVPIAHGAWSDGKAFVGHTAVVVGVALVLVALAAGGRKLVRSVRAT